MFSFLNPSSKFRFTISRQKEFAVGNYQSFNFFIPNTFHVIIFHSQNLSFKTFTKNTIFQQKSPPKILTFFPIKTNLEEKNVFQEHFFFDLRVVSDYSSTSTTFAILDYLQEYQHKRGSLMSRKIGTIAEEEEGWKKCNFIGARNDFGVVSFRV